MPSHKSAVQSDAWFWRPRVLAVAEGIELEELPDIAEENAKEWDFPVTQLEDKNLHERDFELVNLWADSPKDAPTSGMALLGVRPGEFATKPLR